MIKLVHRHNGKIPLISDFVIMWTTTVDVNDLFLIHMILFPTARTLVAILFVAIQSLSRKNFTRMWESYNTYRLIRCFGWSKAAVFVLPWLFANQLSSLIGV